MSHNTRHQGLDLLRIIAMLMIVITHGIATPMYLVQPGSFSYYYLWTMEGICFVAVNCYVLLAGYFLSKSHFLWPHLRKILLVVHFYAFVLYFSCGFLGLSTWTVQGLIGAFFPLWKSTYWFATNYVVLYCLSPYLNKFSNGLTDQEFWRFVAVLFLFCSVWPTSGLSQLKTSFGDYGNICHFIFIYYLGSGIHRIGEKHRPVVNKWAPYVFWCSVLSPPAFKFITHYFHGIIPGIPPMGLGVFYNYASVPIVLGSLALFVLFLRWERLSPVFSSIVRWLSPLTFGVYLIHTSPHFRDWMWNRINLAALLPQQANSTCLNCGRLLLIPIILLVLYLVLSLADYCRFILFALFGRRFHPSNNH